MPMDPSVASFETSAEPEDSLRVSLLDQNLSKYVCFFIPREWVMIPEDGHEVKIDNSFLSTVFLLLNVMIGSGILVQAYVFSQAGIVPTIFEYIIISIMNFTGIQILILCGVKQNIFDYSILADNILGKNGQLTVDISIIVNNAGALLSYIIIVGSLLEDVVLTFSDCTLWCCNIGFLTVLPIAIFTVPLCLIRNFGHLAIISYLSIAVISATVFLVLIGGPIEHSLNDDDDTIKIGSFIGSIQTVGDIVFALGYITAIFHAYQGMGDKSVPVFNQVAVITSSLGALMCFFTGLAGYLSFMSSTDTNILENFSGSLGAVFKLALMVHLILYIPGDFVIMRDAMLKLRNINVNKQSNRDFITFTLTTISIITFVAVMLQLYVGDSLGIVVDLTGGVAGSILYFVVPAFCGMELYKDEPNIYYRSLGLGLFGFVIIIFVILAVAI